MDHASTPAIVFITTFYWIFAGQVARHIWRKKLHKQNTLAIVPIILVFVLCSFAGYLSQLLSHEYWFVREILHWLLAAATFWMVTTKQAKYVAEILTKSDG